MAIIVQKIHCLWFWVIKSNKKEFSEWVFEFNSLHEHIFIDKWHFGNKAALINLYILKSDNFFIPGKLCLKVY